MWCSPFTERLLIADLLKLRAFALLELKLHVWYIYIFALMDAVDLTVVFSVLAYSAIFLGSDFSRELSNPLPRDLNL